MPVGDGFHASCLRSGACQVQAEGGHVDVDAFGVAGEDDEGFVPDADVAAGADAAVEGLPGGDVGAAAIMGEGAQVPGAFPVALASE